MGMKMHKDTRNSLLYRFFVAYHSDHDQYLTYKSFIETLIKNLLAYSSENYDSYMELFETNGQFANSVFLQKNYISEVVQESLINHMVTGENNEFSQINLPWLLAFTYKTTLVIHKFTESTENRVYYESFKFNPSKDTAKFNNNYLQVHMALLSSYSGEQTWYFLSKNYAGTTTEQHEIWGTRKDFELLNADQFVQSVWTAPLEDIKQRNAENRIVKAKQPLQDENDWLEYANVVKTRIDRHIENTKNAEVKEFHEKNFAKYNRIEFHENDLLRVFFNYHQLTNEASQMSFDEMVLKLINAHNVKAATEPHAMLANEKLKLDSRNSKQLTTKSDDILDHNALIIKYYLIDYLLTNNYHQFLHQFMPHLIAAVFHQPVAIHEIGDFKSLTKISYVNREATEKDFFNILIHRHRKYSDKATYYFLIEKSLPSTSRLPDFDPETLNSVSEEIDFLMHLLEKRLLESEPRICITNLKRQTAKLADRTPDFFTKLKGKLQEHTKIAKTTSDFYEHVIRQANFDELPFENDRNSCHVSDYVRHLLHDTAQTGSVSDSLQKYFADSASFLSFSRKFRQCFKGLFNANEWCDMLQVHIAALTKIYANTNLHLVVHTPDDQQAVYVYLPALVYQYQGNGTKIRDLLAINAVGVNGFESPCFYIEKESAEEIREVYNQLYAEENEYLLRVEFLPKRKNAISTASEFCKRLSRTPNDFRLDIEAFKLDQNAKKWLEGIITIVNEANTLSVPKIVSEEPVDAAKLSEQFMNFFDECGFGDMSSFNMLGVFYALVRSSIRQDLRFREFVSLITNGFSEFFENNMKGLPEVAAAKANRSAVDPLAAHDKFSYYRFRLVQYLLGKNVCTFYDAVLPWFLTFLFDCTFELYKIVFEDGKFQMREYKYANDAKKSARPTSGMSTIRAICIDVDGEKSWFAEITQEQIDNFEKELNSYDQQSLLIADVDWVEPKIRSCFKSRFFAI